MGRDISITEVQQYMRCRRMWDFQSMYRQGLQKIGMPSAALHVGAGVHEALAANARGGSWSEALAVWAADELDRYLLAYEAAVGMEPSDSEFAPFKDAYELTLGLLNRYFARYSEDAPLGEKYRYVTVEQTFRVPVPGTDGFFTLAVDGLAEDADGGLWIVEHKTYSTKPDLDRLATDHQLTAYAWAAGAILGQPIQGILYDGIKRALPSGPALLKSGRLSEAWTETIDTASYSAAIERHGLNADDYRDILTRLAERDALAQAPFFTRWKLNILPAQIDAFAGYLPTIYREMTADPGIYPNFRFDGCWDCAVRDLCKATQFGEDVPWLIATYYTKAAGSQSYRQRGGTEVEVDADSVRSPKAA